MAILAFTPNKNIVPTAESPRIRRQSEGNRAHFQLTEVGESNRDYGSSRDLPLTVDFVGLLQALAEAGVGRSVNSLAGTGRQYMEFGYNFVDDDAIKFVIPLQEGQIVPAFAAAYLVNGTVTFVAAYIPNALVELFA